MKAFPKILSRIVLIFIALIIIILIVSKCNRLITPEPDFEVTHAPSATPLNNWLRKDLNATADTTSKYKEKSYAVKKEVTRYRSVIGNSLSKIIGDTSKTDSLFKFAKAADTKIKIDSIVIASQDKQIDTYKAVDSTEQIIKDSIIVDNKKLLRIEKRRSFNKGLKIGASAMAIITAILVFVLK